MADQGLNRRRRRSMGFFGVPAALVSGLLASARRAESKPKAPRKRKPKLSGKVVMCGGCGRQRDRRKLHQRGPKLFCADCCRARA